MPHVSEATSASHDHHDLLLVAAFAAGDLTGTERDQAMALTTSCTECAALRDDLVSIARATAALPPPIASAGRDFRLTADQAASLRRSSWRRLVPASLSGGTARGLGVALATLGLAGLLLGNVSLNAGLGGAAASTAAPAAAANGQENASGGGSYDVLGAAPAASAAFAAASAAPSLAAGLPVPSAAASAQVFGSSQVPSVPQRTAGGDAGAVASDGRSGGPVTAAASAAGSVAPVPAATANDLALESSGSSGSFPLVPLSVVAVIVGVVLIVASLRSRRPAA